MAKVEDYARGAWNGLLNPIFTQAKSDVSGATDRQVIEMFVANAELTNIILLRTLAYAVLGAVFSFMFDVPAKMAFLPCLYPLLDGLALTFRCSNINEEHDRMLNSRGLTYVKELINEVKKDKEK